MYRLIQLAQQESLFNSFNLLTHISIPISDFHSLLTFILYGSKDAFLTMNSSISN